MNISPLVIASHNAGKVREIGELLLPLGIEVVSAGALGLPEPEETGSSFEENAALKAVASAKACGKWSLADDSGLCVGVLEGAPGIYSARWAGADKNFTVAMERIRTEIESTGNASTGAKAYFICVLSLASPEGKVTSFEGRVDGTLTFPPRGNKGFGYDPIFIPTGGRQTFAEIEPAAKHAISHRARAFEKFVAHLRTIGRAEAV